MAVTRKEWNRLKRLESEGKRRRFSEEFKAFLSTLNRTGGEQLLFLVAEIMKELESRKRRIEKHDRAR